MACHMADTKPLFDQGWNIVNYTLKNKLQWNSYIFIRENAFENALYKMAAILSL